MAKKDAFATLQATFLKIFYILLKDNDGIRIFIVENKNTLLVKSASSYLSKTSEKYVIKKTSTVTVSMIRLAIE